MAKDKNALEELRDDLRYLLIHRKGHEAYAAVSDTIDALYDRKNLKPLIIKKIKITEQAWKFLINLPPGLGYSEFKKRESLFADALGGTVQIEKRGKVVTMQVSTAEIKSSYPYSFDPNSHEGYLPVHFGYSAIGEIVRDLSAMPNLIVAGHPGAGKSNFLHGLILGLLINRRTLAKVAIFDFKRLEYTYLREHTLLITEMELARQAFQAINRELTKRLDTLEQAGTVKIQDYLDQGREMPFLVLVIDELAEMQDEECQIALNRILRLGRAAGICVVCATQRPSSTMFKAFGDSKAMFAGTMCFHVRDAVNSQMVLDNDRASLIPAIPGRGVYQWDDELEVQTMFLPTKQARKLLKDVSAMEVNIFDHDTPKRLPPR